MKRWVAGFALLALASVGFADEFFPAVPADMEVSLFASEPLVRNPCAITFDASGRLLAGMGPQYRNPRPDTPGDSVYILVDDDGDGTADRRIQFATGFNCIQGLAWKGGALWVANSPDLTLVRDLDGDDRADEYVRIYTDLGNLEHALHGLNWGPDGKLYMSKGNSKGLTQPPNRVAPRPFRELWGVEIEGLPDFPEPIRFTRENYQRNYHPPEDDWGREGGILRCDPDGSNLEIFARGFRNPWDIAFNDSFDWLGTDNDQTGGDKIFAPFFGAHFGWGHPWSFDWQGEDHLPTAPASGPFFEGSGAGVIYCGLKRYPERYRGVFLINDWLRREVLLFAPRWDGARMLPSATPLPIFASAGTGRSMEESAGKKFDPVDIEIGPDEAIYISSWGRQYGAEFKGAEQANEGRIYRLWPKEAPPVSVNVLRDSLAEWPVGTLGARLGSHVPAWRADAQEEFIRRGATNELLAALEGGKLRTSEETWIAWTLGRMKVPDEQFVSYAFDLNRSLNLRLQSLRILGFRKQSHPRLVQLLGAVEPRLRLEAVQTLRQAKDRNAAKDLVNLAGRETDRIVYYATWQAFADLLTLAERRALLNNASVAIRQAGLLSLLETGSLTNAEIDALTRDQNPAVASLARKRARGSSGAIIRGRPLPTANRKAPAQRATAESVLAALAKANAERGRELFFDATRTGCAACHRIENIGNQFAPDLTDIAFRADDRFIIQSILEPSAHVTEGFAKQTITTTDDEELSGIVAEETGAALKLVLMNGETVDIPRTRIARRTSSRESGMPTNYAELLSAGQIADLTAFLRRGPEFAVVRGEGRFEVRRGGKSILTYIYTHPQLTRPALVNLRTASGVPVTREFPAPEEADHRLMHPGLALSYGWLDGHDYWRLKAPVRHESFLSEPEASGTNVSWTVRNRYLDESASALVCFEEVNYQLSAGVDGLLLKMDATYYNPAREFAFGDQEESGLCLRVPPALAVKGGRGTILNDRGDQNEAGTWGKPFKWVDYSGQTGQESRAGILIVPSRMNALPCWSHSRDYGVLVANPFPRQPKERSEPFVTTRVPKGERFRLSFSVLLYDAH